MRETMSPGLRWHRRRSFRNRPRIELPRVSSVAIGGVAVLPTGSGWSRNRHSAVRSWRGVAAGALIALTVPVAFIILSLIRSLLLDSGVLPSNQVHAPWITMILFSEVFLGPIGLAVAGWSAGVRGVVAWVFLFIAAMPLLSAVWVVSALMFGGATGSPF
jgi:hypothetical protein